MLIAYVVTIVAGYVIGSIPTGLVVGYLFTGGDIRTRGSGKTGATNVLRTAGKLPFAIVVVADIGKGAAPALIGRLVFDSYGVGAAGASAAMIGHVYPVFSGFRGGRGVASAFGGVLVLTPLIGLALPIAGALIIAGTRYVSLMSILMAPLAAIAIVVGVLLDRVPAGVVPFAIFASAFILFTHLPNIGRLLARTEPRIGRGGDRPATG